MKWSEYFILVCLLPVLNGYNLNRTEVNFSPTCASCTAAISAISLVLKWDKSEPVVLEFATIICKLFAKQSWTVCDGISTQFRDEFFYVFRQLSSHNPTAVCGIIIPECADQSDPSQAGWRVQIPPRNLTQAKAKQTLGSGLPALRLLQLTDLHIDLEYQAGSEAECSEPVCCRTRPTDKLKKSAGYWGTVGKCDVPLRTFHHMLKHINSSHQIDMVILTGDYINHVDWAYSIEEHLTVLRKIESMVKDTFPSTPVYWSLGNHEGVPVNSFAPHSVDSRFWPTWLYKQLLKMSTPWLSEEAQDSLLERGSYSTSLIDGLRIISLNTGLCETTNFFLYLNQSDPDGTMTWLVSELLKAEQNEESVYILAHIPPGNSECLEGWAYNYYRVVQRFSKTIRAQFYGHEHVDFFSVFFEDMNNITSNPVNVAFAAPSVTTFENQNPAYRIYEIDDQFRVNDYVQYYADLSRTNRTSPPKWEKLYSAKDAYNLPDMSPTSWNLLVDRIVRSPRVNKTFLRNAYRLPTTTPQCDSTCQKNLLCSLRMGHHNQSLYCPTSFRDHNRITPL